MPQMFLVSYETLIIGHLGQSIPAELEDQLVCGHCLYRLQTDAGTKIVATKTLADNKLGDGAVVAEDDCKCMWHGQWLADQVPA